MYLFNVCTEHFVSTVSKYKGDYLIEIILVRTPSKEENRSFAVLFLTVYEALPGNNYIDPNDTVVVRYPVYVAGQPPVDGVFAGCILVCA